jgi:tRNA-specific 2-thiouridylase
MGKGRSKERVLVGLSGGVDSAVAAALLREKGHDLIGVAMKVYDGSVALNEGARHACFGPGEEEDIESAATVCEFLGIAFHVIDLRAEYRSHVLEYFKNEYLSGRTPNPCVVCNQRLKFGFLRKKAGEAGIDFDFFATGHYARIEKVGNRWLLKRAVDRAKDQSYFLHALTPDQLSRTLLPLGGYTKTEVRALARSLGYQNADRAESQDFMPDGDYAPLFDKKDIREGDIVDEGGNVLGKHRGIVHYTIGQRKGLGIAAAEPLYVIEIDARHHRIVVGGKQRVFARGLVVTDLNLIAIEKLDRSYDVNVKIRLNHKGAAATASPLDNGKAKILFREPQLAVTPGQSAVLYAEDTVIGGGVIERAIQDG